jgi:alpha-tubulin suppressor-like RCC1 family protein
MDDTDRRSGRKVPETLRQLPQAPYKLSWAVLTRSLILAGLGLALATSAGAARTSAGLSYATNSSSGASAAATVPATAIATGAAHSCALTRTDGVRCWGWNVLGQLGDGTTVDRSTPVDVSGLSSGVTAIAAGGVHSCALMSTGGVKCWGSNGGALGDGTTSTRFTPVDVSGLSSGVLAIAAGDGYSCALMTTGGVKCWGSNQVGQLGDGTTVKRSTPVDVLGLSSGVTAIAAGGDHSCALMSTGGVKCWGNNFSGQVGDGTTDSRLTPADVFGLSGGVTAIAAGGFHSCALTATGGVKCWGDNSGFQLGDGTRANHLTPVDSSGLGGGVRAIATGRFHTCVLTTSGSAKCSYGDLGLSGLTAIAAGQAHTCVLTDTGGVRCWGDNAVGQLGDGTTANRVTPLNVVGLGTPKATLAIVSRSVVVTSTRFAAIQLRCGSQADCRGKLALTASVKGKLVGSAARRVQVKLGSRTFSIAAGRTQTVKVKLTSRGLELLARLKRLPTQARISYEQPAGGGTTASRTITLTAPKTPKR